MQPCLAPRHLTNPSLFSLPFNLLVLYEMGICSSQMSRKNGNHLFWKPTVMVIHSDGRLLEFKQPITGGQILSQHPDSFLCSSESMYVDLAVPQIPDDEELEMGQIYFLLPISQASKALSLQDLCGLAMKASIALGFSNSKTSTNSNVNVGKWVAQARNSFRILAILDFMGTLNPQSRRGSQRIEY